MTVIANKYVLSLVMLAFVVFVPAHVSLAYSYYPQQPQYQQLYWCNNYYSYSPCPTYNYYPSYYSYYDSYSYYNPYQQYSYYQPYNYDYYTDYYSYGSNMNYNYNYNYNGWY